MDIRTVLKDNFLQYSSYVIKDRAIASVVDGFKPVQRRIIHSLFEMHDGNFHKVANVVGNTMKYHPHGDTSIYEALVNIANKDLFIEKQGNFGNLFTVILLLLLDILNVGYSLSL
ncbi:DNA topoisomerase 4 subunit A [Borreliella burgdorferi WI91-23]|nr:DNA topoisomerase 4 subunit A [Borreliella burgdorferi WI91-23]